MVEDLANASPLSEHAQRWLRNSRVTIVPMKAPPSPYCLAGNSGGGPSAPHKADSWYFNTSRIADGSDCT